MTLSANHLADNSPQHVQEVLNHLVAGRDHLGVGRIGLLGHDQLGEFTDIADEFTKLIVTQPAYSANTKVITTANSMVQDLLNVLR